MPCYNEAATVKAVVERVLESPYVQELIIVDDGSVDGTRDTLASIANERVRVITQPVNLGKGAAVRRGFAAATSPYVIIQDADLEYDPADYDAMLTPLVDGRADVVFGSRFQAGLPHRVLYYWHSVGNRLLTTASNMATNLNLSDMETCYKAFRREVLDSLDLREDRFGIEPEITAKVARQGWRIYEVGISYSGRTYAEGKKIGWRDGMRALYCIARYARSAQTDGPRPASVEGADAEVARTHETLDDARNYAAWIASLAEPYLGDNVLEVGAGDGLVTRHLPHERRVTTTDGSVPVEGGPFDSVVMVNVLERVADDVTCLRQVKDALVPGGRAVLWVSAFEALYGKFDRQIGHHRRYRTSTLVAAVSDAGLELDEVRYANAVGGLAWWLVAAKLGRSPVGGSTTRLFDRAVVPAALRLEAGRRLPFGQSIFCVVHRPA
jgi:SAM-dependent methyltransferase